MSNTTLVVGSGQFIDKNAYHSDIYKKNDISIHFLVDDIHGNSQYYANMHNASIEILHPKKFSRIIQIWKAFKKHKNSYCELYDTGRMTFIYLFLSIFYKHKLILILRGGEVQRHNKKKLSINYWKHWLIEKFAHKIIYKEQNIFNEYKANGYSLKKLYFIGNAVPLPMVNPYCYEERNIDILFLNSVRSNRNVLFIVKCIEKLNMLSTRKISCVIAGFNSLSNDNLSFDLEEERFILEYIKKNNLTNNITTLPFVKDPHKFYQKAKIFVFPAEIVFANYALLASMSYGVVPIISQGEGASKIVTHNEGYSLELTVDLWVKEIMDLLNNPDLWKNKSLASQQKIRSEFSMDSWFKEMMHARSGKTNENK